eukprot:gene3713-6602_t
MSEGEKTENVNVTTEENTEKVDSTTEENNSGEEVKFDEESDHEHPPQEETKNDDEEEEEEEEEYIDDDSGGDYNEEEPNNEEEEEKVTKGGDEDEDFEISKTKKRKRSQKPKTIKKKKKSKNSIDQDELDEEDGLEQQTRRKEKSEENEEFDRMMREFKIVKGKKYKDSDEISNIEEQAEKMAKNMVQNMKDALEQDNISLLNKKPATSKLKILSSVVAACSKSYLQPQLLEEKLLDVLADWIKPTEDKQLPNMNIRSAVFKILSEIPVKGVTKRVKSSQTDFDGIEVSHLRGSEIGKLIKMYSIHPKETMENRKMASLIIEKWSRMIFDLSDDYKSSSGTQKSMKKRLVRNEEDDSTVKSTRARLPKKTGFDFVRQPKSKIEMDLKRGSGETSESEKALQRKLRDLSRKPKF